MASVRIDRALNRKLRITRFLSFPQFAELMVQHRLQLEASVDAAASSSAQRWHTEATERLAADQPPPTDATHTIQIVSDVGALADSLFADAHTELSLEPSFGQTSGSQPTFNAGVDLVVKSFGAGSDPADDDHTPTVPVLVDVARLVKGVGVASNAPAHFAALISRMVRDHVWIDVAQYAWTHAHERSAGHVEPRQDDGRPFGNHARSGLPNPALRSWRASRRIAAGPTTRRKISILR